VPPPLLPRSFLSPNERPRRSGAALPIVPSGAILAELMSTSCRAPQDQPSEDPRGSSQYEIDSLR
jgi:hypothetical protein